jgi:L-amino acid N-acyltransferase
MRTKKGGMEIRLARPDDALAIEAIYAHYVCTSTCTWQEVPGTLAERRQWLADHGPAHPVTAATIDGQVVGWGALSPFNRRSGYRFTVEDSVYVRADRQRRGIGRALLADLVERAGALGYRNVIAGVSADQRPSIALHAAHGFTEVARMPQLGLKFGSWHDLVYLQLQVR